MYPKKQIYVQTLIFNSDQEKQRKGLAVCCYFFSSSRRMHI